LFLGVDTCVPGVDGDVEVREKTIIDGEVKVCGEALKIKISGAVARIWGMN